MLRHMELCCPDLVDAELAAALRALDEALKLLEDTDMRDALFHTSIVRQPVPAVSSAFTSAPACTSSRSAISSLPSSFWPAPPLTPAKQKKAEQPHLFQFALGLFEERQSGSPRAGKSSMWDMAKRVSGLYTDTYSQLRK